ncbi:hyaluronidase-1 isoform X1 [Alligator sinensis]|uniref:Hyaluronidase n=1 Tax=Alligator sinensis TaxID=38654 RepID=A0A1U7RPT1_ALLSI|nr:hyaluronidase-1 isoform X1 [Alligator sinensis]XP_025060120.1 hyaluronidase-1 isoform X1 [Alligator sinensis]
MKLRREALGLLLSWACLLSLPMFAWGFAGHGTGPIFFDRPFVTVWNAPTENCEKKFHVSLDLGIFDVVLNRNESFMGNKMTIFYSTKLGLYPYYTKDGFPVNGGVPFNSSLPAHLQKAEQDIKADILDPNFRGLAVIDWESWRPLWVRNWDSLDIYKKKSIALVQERHPDWSPKRVVKKAELVFEKSGRAFMDQTLALGECLRPGGFWGFYGFPCCYNNDFKNVNYTGECPEIEQQRNDQLQWLWNQSGALYPSIYLPKELEASGKVLTYVRHRIGEAFRVQKWVTGGSLPVIPYAHISYELTDDFLSQEDLENTIGESASQGAAGIVLWGSEDYSNSRESCLAVKKFVDGILGHYIMNVTSSTILCSEAVCSSHGRCVRRDTHPEAYLHLSPASFTIERDPKEHRFFLLGHKSDADEAKMMEEFICQCYEGWEGEWCENKATAE